MYKKAIVFSFSIILFGCSDFQTPNYQDSSSAPLIETKEVDTLEPQLPLTEDVIEGVVIEVVDGNQFKVKVGESAVLKGLGLSEGQIVVVKMLATKAPDNVEGLPFGNEAYVFLKDILEGEEVKLELDTRLITDTTEPLLAYPYIDGNRVQDLLLTHSFSMVSDSIENSPYAEELKKIELDAKNAKQGIWAIPDYADSEEGFNQLAVVASKLSEDIILMLEKELKLHGQTITKELESIANEGE